MNFQEAFEKWDKEGYIQTWYLMPRYKPLRRLIQHFHGLFFGHVPSKTEWRYRGGDFADLNCRWCDQRMQMPIDETFIPDDLKDIVKKMRKQP